MDLPLPFCERCGRVGASLSGMHPERDGIVRWTLYRCGHVHTQLVVEEPLDAMLDATLPDRTRTDATLERIPAEA